MHGLFALAVYLGFFENIEGAKNIAVGVGWLLGVVGVMALVAISINREIMAREMYKNNYMPSVPFVIDAAFDLVIVSVFLWFGHQWLSAFYIIQIIAGKAIRDITKEYTFEMLQKDRKNDH